MSLFKICSWWSVQCSDISDNYDSSSMCCERLGLVDGEKDYIIVGSHNGNLSIFYPNCEINSDDGIDGYKPTDLIFETKLDSSILSVAIGKFIGATTAGVTTKNENINQLAILHPYSLVIYNLICVDGVAEHGKQSSLQLIVEHKFNRSAYSLCKGTFGRTKGREFLCIVHMDGVLTFYEQDGISYECYLPGPKAIPIVMTYIQRTDSFVRMNFCWELESFSYQDVSQSSDNKSQTKTISPTWSICLGEFALDICPVQVTNTRTAIMILGEHNLICVSDDGRIQFIIKLDYSPKCFHAFVVGWYWEPNARLITAVVSESSSLLIYEETKLIWALQLDVAPVAIQRSNLNNLPGGIIMLHENGLLNAGYLGSEPFVFKAPPLNLQEMDFEKAYTELMDLEKEIRQRMDTTDVEMINSLTNENLILQFKLLPNFEKYYDNTVTTTDEQNHRIDDDGALVLCTGELIYTTKIDYQQIQIQFNTAIGILCSQSITTLNDVKADTSEKLQVKFCAQENLHISSLQVDAIVSSINYQIIPRIQVLKAFLPLNLVYKKCPPQKDAKIKLTFTLHTKILESFKLSTIFSDLLSSEEIERDNELQAVGIQLQTVNDDIVTVVAAKNTKRFRIQSDCLEMIPAVLEVIINSLQTINDDDDDSINLNSPHVDKRKEDLPAGIKKREGRKRNLKRKMKILVMETPQNFPIQEILQRIDRHHEHQNEIQKQSNLMEMLWNQFKLFQRSLQMKQETDPVSGLMMLIERNYDDLVKEGDHLMNIRSNEQIVRSDLSCTITLAKHLISCLKLNEQIFDAFNAIFNHSTDDWTETSWEEALEPAVTHLHDHGPLSHHHKNVSEKNDKRFNVMAITTEPTEFDYARFKRHMTALFDRICRLALMTQKQQLQILTVQQQQQKSEESIAKNGNGLKQELTDKSNSNQKIDDTNGQNKRLETLPDHDDDDDDADDNDGDENDGDETNKTNDEGNWFSDVAITSDEMQTLKNMK